MNIVSICHGSHILSISFNNFLGLFTEPCETNVFIDNYKRSVAYVPTDEFICDSSLKEGWYRITSGAGELMPTECVEFGWRCGTANPIYLKDGK